MPPKKTGVHQNQTAWVAHKHQEDLRLTDTQLEGWLDNCCEKCVEVLQWRRKYGKYKSLAKPAKCHGCQERVVRHAYLGLCVPCARVKKACAKCEGPFEIPHEEIVRMEKERELRKQIADLPERFKRAAERKLERGDDLGEVEKAVNKGLGKKIKSIEPAPEKKTDDGTEPAKPSPDSDSDSDEVL
eukprot:TRINITY_DN15958_c0_g1_i1.p1 TRINITY_DN15958_c0_g1~~TRINITY_DN15958_c0_g1_i1.p1  ORF type:complete len:204 (+),score=54.02 TRINITY_DN15958_c0_g1_i1:56-613(+)